MQALRRARNFILATEHAAEEAEAWWTAAFTPPAQRAPEAAGWFAGHLPALETQDAALARAYYGGLLSFLLTGMST